MSEYVLKVEGAYAIVMEAACIEDAADLARASDEWLWPTPAHLYAADGSDSQSLMIGAELPVVSVHVDVIPMANAS